MARTKRGVVSRAKHNKVLKSVKGQRGRRTVAICFISDLSNLFVFNLLKNCLTTTDFDS